MTTFSIKADPGIAGLDDVTDGGLARTRLFLLEGSTGTGKTNIATQCLIAGAQERRHDGEARVAADRTAAASQAPPVLIVDDEALVRKGTAEMLRHAGHRVVEAEGGAEAPAPPSLDTSIEALVTDCEMPRMDGGELARRIRADRPGLPILLIPGYTGAADPIEGLPRLGEPFGLVELAAALDPVVHPRRQPGPAKPEPVE